MVPPSKTDELSKNFQTAFASPPSFRKVMLQIVFNFILKKPRLEAKNRQYKFWQFYGNSSFLEVPPDTRPKERRGSKDNEDKCGTQDP